MSNPHRHQGENVCSLPLGSIASAASPSPSACASQSPMAATASGDTSPREAVSQPGDSIACRAGGALQSWPRNSCKGLRARHCAMSCSPSCSPMRTLTAATPLGVGDAVAQRRRLASAPQQRGSQGLKLAVTSTVARHHRRRLHHSSESASLMDAAAAPHQRRDYRSESGAMMTMMGPAAWHQRQHQGPWRHRRQHCRGSEPAATIRASTAALETEVGAEA